MEILATARYALGAEVKLVKVDDDFYMYGTQAEFDSLLGVSVDHCGSLEKVLSHCLSIAELCKKNIVKYQKEFEKDRHEGWQMMIEHEKADLDMLLLFAETLKSI